MSEPAAHDAMQARLEAIERKLEAWKDREEAAFQAHVDRTEGLNHDEDREHAR